MHGICWRRPPRLKDYYQPHTPPPRALRLTPEAGSEWFSAYVRNQLGQIALERGRHDEADAQFSAGYLTREAFDDRAGMATARLNQAGTAAQRGDQHVAACLYSESLMQLREVGDRSGTARALVGLGTLAAARGARQEAWEQFQRALEIASALAYHYMTLEIVTHLAQLMLVARRPVEAPAPLTLALLHPASRSVTTLRAQQLLARCEELLPADAFAKEVAHGYTAKLDSVVEQLLGSTAPQMPLTMPGCQ
jgi:tetratricopeptide (TPR) repeat protein